MSYPILYSATETNFDHNGIGILSACVSCEVTEEANGIFELAMQYPMDGVHFAEIGDRAIIKAKADQFRDPQLFRVYAISKLMDGIVTVLAEHISYDLSGIPVKPFSAPAATSSLSMLKSNAVVDCPFDFWTDKETQGNFKVSVPASIRSRLGGVAGSILDVYGGEYEFDNFTVKLHNSRGQNRGVSIRYGKNLTDIQQDQNCSNVATGVYPYWVDSEGAVLIELPEKIVNAPGTYNFVKIRTVDFSSEFETQPTVDQLRARTESYIKANNIGVPIVSWSVSFEQLSKSDEYKHLALLERVSLFDTVNVEFPALGVSATAKAVKMVYDVLADKVKSVTLGSVRSNIADTIAGIGETAKQEAIKVVKGQTSEEIFNQLTNYGRIQGMYIEDGKWYINAELAKIINLIAEHLSSTTGKSEIRITGAELQMLYDGLQTLSIFNNYAPHPILYLNEYENGTHQNSAELGASFLKLGGDSINPLCEIRTNKGVNNDFRGFIINDFEGNDIFRVFALSDNLTRVGINGQAKAIEWKYSDELKTYVLCGS